MRFLSVMAGGCMMVFTSNFGGTLEQIRSARDGFIDGFRVTGILDTSIAAGVEKRILAFLEKAGKTEKAPALFELATMQRIGNRFADAVRTYEEAAMTADAAGNRPIAFDALIGLARAHLYGTKDHGAAAGAFDRAVAIAGSNPTPKQRHDMAAYSSQLQAGRGELEPALLNALKAIRLAGTDADKFHALNDASGVFLNFAESCDYRKVVDALTNLPGGDPWGGCRRSIAAAAKYQQDAKKIARKKGWNFLASQADQFLANLDRRSQLVEMRVSSEKLKMSAVFDAQDVGGVLVNEDFSAGGSALGGNPFLKAAIDEATPDSHAASPRNQFLRGVRADLDNQPEKALVHFQQAVALLRAEHASFFDPRRQGTVLENRIELVTNLALRLLASGKPDEAFTAFESVRANGLAEMTDIHSDPAFPEEERRILAEAILLESKAAALANKLVESVIADSGNPPKAKSLDELDGVEAQRILARKSPEFLRSAGRYSRTKKPLPGLREFQSLLRKEKLGALLYWVTHTNVVVWVITPKASQVRTVFIPEPVLAGKIELLLGSIKSASRPFDEKRARELHTYLVKPFAAMLGENVLIIPQGPLVRLPFEALMDAKTGKFLAEEKAVSYFPNVKLAMRSLGRPLPRLSKVSAVYDNSLEDITREIARISAIPSLQVASVKSQKLSRLAAIGKLGEGEISHALLHGFYNIDDPLLSELSLNNAKGESVTAADLLTLDWGKTRLAVFGSCEGAVVKTRISNEVLGFPWALLAGGVDCVVLSRWEVLAASNADWMESFYEALAQDRATPALAAASAMRKAIQAGRRHPFYWAGPQVFGR